MRPILIILVCSFFFSRCIPVLVPVPVRQGPPPHAKAHGHHKKNAHVYHYYPDLEIYWSPATKTYMVLKKGSWVVYKSRPVFITPAYNYIVLKIDEPKPWKKHKHYKKKYPPGLAKKGKHKNKW